MIDIERILDLYRKDTRVRHDEDCIFITPPFYHSKSDESIAIRVTEAENGLITLSDCHTTEDYLELRDVYLNEYSERLERVIKRFGLIHDGNVFRITVPSREDNYIEFYLGYFIQALSIIANIDL